ncbi:hypothetical protein ALC57_15681 [Trachymyrmex cornetzi]|uniref:Uncharacterized protein n=1 Tax=Trachymyrmex cornetzi TaxID=471704 RepID=A0A151IWJ4_9HYME|nr:hypothetical protein ALC57_15681 [Trachymyrmex cornetzi]
MRASDTQQLEGGKIFRTRRVQSAIYATVDSRAVAVSPRGCRGLTTSAAATATAARIIEADMARHFRVGEREPLTRTKAASECPVHEYHSPVHSRATLHRSPRRSTRPSDQLAAVRVASREKPTHSGPSNGEITDGRMANQADAQSGARQRRCKDRVKQDVPSRDIF